MIKAAGHCREDVCAAPEMLWESNGGGRFMEKTVLSFGLRILAMAFAAVLTITSFAYAQGGGADLRQEAQNPVADLISLPLQNNMNFNVGRLDHTQNILNIQPVVPIHLNENWNLITRSIMPVIYQPALTPGEDAEFGLGDFNPAFFFSPVKPVPVGKGLDLVWGAGPVFAFPTATDSRLGSDKWSAGPTFVALLLSEKVVTGVLINNLWSYAGDSDRPDVNVMTLQPFLNYNLPKGWYLTSSPVITANWEANTGDRWTIPVGGGIGRIFHIGKQPINAQVNYYYNVESPNSGGDSQLRTQWTFLFPTRH